MATDRQGFEIRVAAAAENVPLVRHALRAYLETVPMPEDRVAEVVLAVTEACANVVVHAYPDADGDLQVAADLDGDVVEVRVRDNGRGITPRVDSPGLGVGLPVMAAIADSIELGKANGSGTEVRMTFAVRDTASHPGSDSATLST